MSVPDGWIDPPEDLVEEGEEAYRKWEENLGPLPELEELDAEPCEPEDSEEPPAWHENLVAPDDLAWVEIPE